MPVRRAPSSRAPSQPSGEDGIDFKFSQGSSDDHGNETFAVVAAEFKATWEKRMRGRDDKIIQATQKELELALKNKEIEMSDILNHIENIHQEFLEKYAILEDKKRKIIVAMAEKRAELLPLTVRSHQAIINVGHEVENGQLQGMVLLKRTCQRLGDLSMEFGTLDLDDS